MFRLLFIWRGKTMISKTMIKIGFHIPYSGNLKRLTNHVKNTGGNCFQFYSRTMRGGRLPELNNVQLVDYYQFIIKNNINDIILHSPLTVNLCEYNEEQLKLLRKDLEYANLIQAKYYVLLPGRRKGLSKEEAINNIYKNLDFILNTEVYNRYILIRNTEGAGTQLGGDIQTYSQIINFHKRIKGALDFASLFAFGYPITSKKGLTEIKDNLYINNTINKIDVFYANDTEYFCSSRNEKKTTLGKGVIGKEGYRLIIENFKEFFEKIIMVENVRKRGYYYDLMRFFLEENSRRRWSF